MTALEALVGSGKLLKMLTIYTHLHYNAYHILLLSPCQAAFLFIHLFIQEIIAKVSVCQQRENKMDIAPVTIALIDLWEDRHLWVML